MNHPLVSIITPTLNRCDTLRDCLFSVVRQSYARIEHIVIDGGSTDGTVEYLRHVAAGRPMTRWISEPDDGMYDAINKGLALARGDVVAYLNSDDLYLPWSVEVAVSALKRTGADLVYGDLGVLIRETRRHAFYVQFYKHFDLRHYTHHETLAQPTVFWRRSLVREIGEFDASYRLLGDCDYWLRAAVAGARLQHLDEILAVQVEHEETLRATRAREVAAEFTRLRAQYAGIAGPAGGALAAGIGRRLRWRAKQTQFLLSARSRGSRWPRFGAFTRERALRVRPTYILWHLLPSTLRPKRVTLVDPRALERCLGAPESVS